MAAADKESGAGEEGSYYATFSQGHNDKFPRVFERTYSFVVRGVLPQDHVSDTVKKEMNNKPTWQQRMSLMVIQVLWLLAVPVAALGDLLEFVLNVVVANGGVFKTVSRLLASGLFFFNEGPLTLPAKDSADYKTLIGLIDPRTALYVDKSVAANEQSDETTSAIFPGPDYGNRRTADVMVMAAKLAYENEAKVRNVVTEEWSMNFVGFYNCWNEFEQRKGTEVFIFTDRLEDANAVVVAWRGTEVFNAYDWATDIDFSWYDLGAIGKVHLGFLEALGLADRRNMETFHRMREKNKFLKLQATINTAIETLEDLDQDIPASGLSQEVINEPEKALAYDYITAKVKKLLAANPNAKLFCTGHSLGGALAALYTGMLYYNDEYAVTNRIAAVYTFGQPRVGNERFGHFMVRNLSLDRYFRVVYCNDLVPRVPFDDSVFRFKHWGCCFYYNSLFRGQTLYEAPNKNFFFITDLIIVHINAVWELINSLYLHYGYGPEYRESLASIVYRVMAIMLPGVGGHSPVNYVNAVRLGTPSPMAAKASQEIHDFEKDLHDMEVMVRKNVTKVFLAIRCKVLGTVWSH